MDLDGLVDDVDEPTIGDSGTRIEAELVVAIRAVRGLSDLDDEGSARGMRVTIGVRISRGDAHVGLGLRYRVRR